MKHAVFSRGILSRGGRRMVWSGIAWSGVVCSRKVLPLPCLLMIGTALFGQSREAYQQAYRDWRANDPNLEREAPRIGDAVAPRADRAALAAGTFMSARGAFYEAQRDDLAEKLKTLQPFELPKEMESARTAEGLLAGQEASATTSIEVFGSDPDKGVQQLRQALERERQALVALRGAIKARETAADAVKQANENADRTRSVAAGQIKVISDSFAQSGQDVAQMAEAWPAYYRALASGARGPEASDTMPAPVIRPADSTPAVASPAPVTSIRPAPAVPISRYTGSWTFLPGVSTYRGLPPVSFDVSVREEGGQIAGTVNARFIVAANADPNVRLDFSGPMQAARYQTFPLKTAEGAKGTLELIPGNAFNLLEVNYTLEGAPGKVRESDVILVKR